MFQNAKLHNEASYISRTNTLDVFKEFYQYLKHGEKEFITDSGSGSGNVTTEVLVPTIQHSNFRLVGIDISKPMAEFTKDNVNDPRISFRELDLTEKNEERLTSVFLKEELEPGFHKIFSFSVTNLHWYEEIHTRYQLKINVWVGIVGQQCLRNMFTLLRPGRQILIWFIVYLGLCCEVWKSVCSMAKWQAYFKNETDFKFQHHDSTDPKSEVVDLLKRIGFQDFIICECVRKELATDVPINGKPQIRRKNTECIDPNMHKLPKQLKSEYMDDVMEILKLYQSKPQGLTFDRITVVATKPI